jgi:transposase
MEMKISLKDALKTARLSFDARLAEVLIARPDLSYTEVEKDFGISETVIRRVIKQFNIGARKRGPKPGGLTKAQKQAVVNG